MFKNSHFYEQQFFSQLFDHEMMGYNVSKACHTVVVKKNFPVLIRSTVEKRISLRVVGHEWAVSGRMVARENLSPKLQL